MANDSGSNICQAALRKLRAIDPGETANATDLARCFEEFKRMIKSWGILGNAVYASTVDVHTLTDGATRYSIGSGGDIDTVRPIRLVPGCFVTAGGYDYPLSIKGEAEYLQISDKEGGGGDVASIIWLDPQYPLAYVNLWAPTGGELNLYSLKPLAEPATVDADIVYPDEYQDPIVWNLACRMSPEFVGEPTPYLMAMAQHTLEVLRQSNAANDLSELENEITMLGIGHAHYNIDRD
jgi:hypothetical protein